MKYGTLFAYWTQEWKGDYPFFARKVADLGFDILEVSAGQLLELSDPEIDRLRGITEELGIRITSNIGPAKDKDISSKDASVRAAGILHLTDIMRKMERLGSTVLAGVLYSHWPCDFQDVDKPAAWALGVESTRKLADAADGLGVELCLEVVNRFETYILNTSEEGVAFCRDIGRKNVKVLLDTFHMNIEEDSIPNAIRTAGSLLGHLHVGEGNRKVPGQGALPWTEIGQALRDIDYRSGVVMEPFVKPGGQVGRDIKVWHDLSRGASTEEMDRQIRDSLVFLKSRFE